MCNNLPEWFKTKLTMVFRNIFPEGSNIRHVDIIDYYRSYSNDFSTENSWIINMFIPTEDSCAGNKVR